MHLFAGHYTSGGTNGAGTIFRIGTNGAGYSVLYSFGGTGGDGAYPGSGLVQGSNMQLSFLPPYSVASGISVSTNLSNWSPLTNLPATANPVYYEDIASTNYPQRFYRALWVAP